MKRHFFTLFALLIAGMLFAVDKTVTYTFTSSSWEATLGGVAANWISGQAGYNFSNDGVGVTTGVTGANATCPDSYDNISKVVVTYNTNKSKGEGMFDVQIGDNDATSLAWQYSGDDDGRSANFHTDFEYSTPQSGAVKLTVNTTTNSAYVVSVAITYNPASDPTALDNTASEQKTIKTIENGRLVIIRDGLRYNALGTRIL